MSVSYQADNAALLKQGLLLLGNLDTDLYTAPSPMGASVGGHLRHIVDFYVCFLRGCEEGVIDYDRRNRDAAVETEVEIAKDEMNRILGALQSHVYDADAQLSVKVEASNPPQFAFSSYGRELQFLLSHTVHHYALISYVLGWLGFSVPIGFGVAPSTLEYLRAESLAG